MKCELVWFSFLLNSRFLNGIAWDSLCSTTGPRNVVNDPTVQQHIIWIICSDIPKYFPVFQFWQSLFSSKWVTPRVPKVAMAIPPVKQCNNLLQYNGKCLQKEWRKKPSCSSIIKDLDLHSSNQQVNFSISFYKNTLHALHININGTFFFHSSCT